MNRIELNFNKSTTSLAGFPYGETIYHKQVENKVVFGEPITIVFPKQIERIASSFVQGIFSEFVDAIGYEGVEKQVTILSGTEELTESIKKNIY